MTSPSTVIEALRSCGASVATAESLTGGLVCAALVDVPGASEVVRGGIVAYQSQVKAALLDVPTELLAARGTVDPKVAVALACGARSRLDATYAVSTTGVAGPGPVEGKPAGTVYIAVAGPREPATVEELALEGGRDAVRHGAVAAALSALAARLRMEETGASAR